MTVALATRCDDTTNEEAKMNTPDPKHDEPGDEHRGDPEPEHPPVDEPEAEPDPKADPA
jgi:hypothetical protein